MSNGYLVAAVADLAAAHEIADGFGLDVIDASAVHDRQTTSAALAGAANVGFMLSDAAAQDEAFVALLQNLATQSMRVQLILVTPEARGAFGFLHDDWPAMSLDEARVRSNELLRRRQAEAGPDEGAQRAEPLPPASEPAPAPQQEQAEQETPTVDEELAGEEDVHATTPAEVQQGEASGDEPQIAAPGPESGAADTEPPVVAEEAPPPSAAESPSSAPPPINAPEAPPPPAPAPAAPPQAPAPQTPPAERSFGEPADMYSTARSQSGAERLGETAPADATAFAPGKLRRGTPELVRIVVHQPKDLNAVIRAAKKVDPRTEPAPQGMSIGAIALGANVGIALEVRGGDCEGALQRREWRGEPIDFSFSVEAEAGVKQVVMLARVFVDDAQIGVLAFTRKVSGPAKRPHGLGDRARLKRHKRVFLSYSSQDRDVVSAIATAYQMAGVEHFWDRTSLKSGEEWSPRLRREIDRADLFHLCWSKSAAHSEWVAKEAEHALTRRRKQSGKPEITVQMLDGPPWAPHPASLDAINFDDFVRAAIVGYARGDAS